ncbi:MULTISPECIES: hypothetical protein [spotted fever group]|uniref:Uncharacterized protein n=2 Tax=spotted fever group TaxID=114277 RepID=A0A0F3PE85_RICRH|nr:MULTISPECIES: hypothetical protein [spotted fever group]AFB31751.1 hypothetical protein RMB_04915 [Rickettsia massiliae str. AZT80]KJV78257.1 hypothetical protein RMAECT_1282 [Rickettsia rhipicephali str. Ect]
MPVLVDNIEVQIEKIYEVFDLIDNEGADLLLWAVSDCLAELLDQYKESLTIEYVDPLMKRFEEQNTIIPKMLNSALSNILLILEDGCKSEESELIV